jgi:hypothetical protein
MPLPKPINPLTLNGMKKDQSSYETAKSIVAAHNTLIASLGPGPTINSSHFIPSKDVTVTQASGSLKRGNLSATIGSAPGPTSTIHLPFPPGTFSATPFAQITRNGGTGGSNYSYQETANGVTITIATPITGETYGFNYAVQD